MGMPYTIESTLEKTGLVTVSVLVYNNKIWTATDLRARQDTIISFLYKFLPKIPWPDQGDSCNEYRVAAAVVRVLIERKILPDPTRCAHPFTHRNHDIVNETWTHCPYCGHNTNEITT